MSIKISKPQTNENIDIKRNSFVDVLFLFKNNNRENGENLIWTKIFDHVYIEQNS